MNAEQFEAIARAHGRMIMEAIAAELEHNRQILEESLETGVLSNRELSTATWERYQAHIRPRSLRLWLHCCIKGHVGDVCEKACCEGLLEWCSRCGAVRLAGHRSRARKSKALKNLAPEVAMR